MNKYSEREPHDIEKCPRCTAWRNLPEGLIDEFYSPPHCFHMEMMRVLMIELENKKEN